MSSSLLLQRRPACLVRLTCIVFYMGGRWLYSWYLVGCCRFRHSCVCMFTYVFTYICICIYTYICVCIYIVIHRQTVSFYQNSSVWLDTQDARSRDRNTSNFTLDLVSDLSATKRTTLAKGILRYFYF